MSAPWRGKKLTDEHKARIKAGVLAAKAAGKNIGGKGCKKPGSGSKPGHPVSEAQRIKTSDTMTGQIYPQERCQAFIDAFTPTRRAKLALNKFDGGAVAEDFAAILCPAGFNREYTVWFGNTLSKIGRRSGCARLDFAHIAGKVAIELDGQSHNTTARSRKDFSRDAILRSLGWKVIRIRV